MEKFSLISIYCGGGLSLFMVIFHAQFFKLFHWKKEFEKLTEINRRILYTIHLALLLLIFVFSSISFIYAAELSRASGISCGILIGYALFWLWRTLWQIFYFKPDKKSRLLFLHYSPIVIFFLLCISYSVPVVITR